MQPNPLQFLALPIVGTDLVAIFRNGDISSAKYITYAKFLEILKASIQPSGGGSGVEVKDEGSVIAALAQFLNFVGAGVTVTPNGLGVDITIPGGGGGAYTVNNGLTENPANNFQLGGALIQNTTVDATSAFYMRFTGAKSGKTNQTLEAINTGNGFAFLAQALSAPSAGAIRVLTNGVGISIEQSVQGFDIQQSGGASVINLSNASNNTVDPVLILGRLTNIPPLVGSGGSVQINLNSASTPNSAVLGGVLGFELTSLSPSEETKYFCSVRNGGIPQRVHEVFTTGQHRFNKYGLNTFAGTPTYALGVDSSGNVVEFTPSGGGGNSIGELTGDVTAGPAISPAQSVSSTLKTNLRVGSVGVTVDGVTSVIQVGQVGYVEMPYDGSITNWSITGNTTGSIVFDVWKASGVIPTVANTMIGLGTKPSLSSQQINLGVPTGWTTVNFLAGDILGFYVDSALTLRRATLTLRTNKS